MKIIRELSDYIEEEIGDACKYVKKALEYKTDHRPLADVYFALSQEEMRHMTMLHNEVVKIIDEFRKTDGDPPDDMMAIYNYLHKKQIDRAGEVKAFQQMYKE